jgi:chorismate mutase/prephenate dehydratase
MKLTNLRKKIDEIDNQILALFNKRVRTTSEIAKVKKKEKLEYYLPHREEEIYRRLKKQNKGPFPNKALEEVYREIISASLSVQKPLKITYFGPEATFTHLASMRKFGSSPTYIPVKSIADVFSEVEKGRANYGVVPVENSTEGVINHTLDMFINSDLKIISEILLEISLNLLSRSQFKEIKKIYSHPQAIAQSRSWVENNLSGIKIIEVSSTAEAASRAAKEKPAGAIASELAAKLYNLKIVASHIEDTQDNVTRFLVIGKTLSKKTGRDKTSIMFSIKDRPGALYDMLRTFSKEKINLTKIESRPSKKKAWEYIFFVDFQGHIEDKSVKKALGALEKDCLLLKILGAYPMARSANEEIGA